MTVVGILGTYCGPCEPDIYLPHIVEFKPDVICGEVHPNTWNIYLQDKSKRRFWGEAEDLYYDIIFPFCENNDVEFIPVDWFELDVWEDFDPFSKVSDKDRTILEAELNQWKAQQLERTNAGLIPFNSFEYDEIARKKYKWLYEVNAESQIFRWVCRNQIMVQRIKNAIKKNYGKRILCIAGADHNYCYYDGLKQEALELIYPLK